jgi:hypothetical protein
MDLGQPVVGVDKEGERTEVQMAATAKGSGRRESRMLKGLRIIAAVGALLGLAGGYTVALASGHGGHGVGRSAHGGTRAAARAPPPSSGSRRHIRHFGALVGYPGYGPYSPYPYPHEADYGTYFSDPSSPGYVPYCDPGSMYYDPSSCEELIP